MLSAVREIGPAVAREGDRRPREVERAAVLARHDLDDVGVVERVDAVERLGRRAHDRARVGRERLDRRVDRRRRQHRLVALDVHDELGVEPGGDLRETVGTRLVIGARHHALVAGGANGVEHPLVVGRHDHARDRRSRRCAIAHVHDHRLSCDREKRFTGESGRCVTSGNDCDRGILLHGTSK